MKIIKNGINLSRWKKNVKCDACSTEMQIKSNDLIYSPEEQDGVYFTPDYYYINCPNCDSRIRVSLDDAFLAVLNKHRK